ncbi:MAG: choice-of-anchor tandem repeat NxxGxxAF-containing protein [Planctomycetota bacterium]
MTRSTNATAALAVASLALAVAPAVHAQFVFDTLALEGEIAPNSGGATYAGSFTNPTVNASGVVAFEALFAGGTSPTSPFGVYTVSPGGTQLLIRSGDAIPGTSLTFGDVEGSVIINANGEVAFSASSAVLTADAIGNVTTLAFFGQTAPGVPELSPGVVESFQNLSDVSFNNAGQVAFSAKTFNSFSDDFLYRTTPSGVLELAAQRDQSPPTGGLFAGFEESDIADNGLIVFEGFVNNPPSGVGRESLHTVDPSGVLETVITEEVTVAPPEFGNNTFSFLGEPEFDAAGNVFFDGSVAFGTGVDGSNNEGLFVVDPAGNVTTLLREGDPVPGGIGTFDDPSDQAFSEAGLFATVADVITTGLSDREALFLGDLNGISEAILLEGELFEVAPGDFRVIDDIDLVTGGFAGDFVAVRLSFRDGGGDTTNAIVRVTIPEPSTVALLSLGGLLFSRRGRHANTIGADR